MQAVGAARARAQASALAGIPCVRLSIVSTWMISGEDSKLCELSQQIECAMMKMSLGPFDRGVR